MKTRHTVRQSRARIALGLIIVLGIIAALTPLRPGPVDLSSGKPLADARVIWPLWRYAFEPFTATAEYILSFSRYMVQLFSWIFWLGAGAFVVALFRRKKIIQAGRAAFVAALSCITVVLLILFLPFPAPRLLVSGENSIVDFHNHTYYSHDGVMSPSQSLFFHRRLGFDSFYITEHGHTNSFSHFPAEKRLTGVFPGMQISTKERVSLLVLADRPFDGKPYRDKTAQEVIDMAHAAGFAVICPHWWKWRYFTWDEFRQKGIDGFEVYNAGYRNFSDQERDLLVAFCKENNLAMTSSTDWHGWGYISNAWTVLPGMRAADATAVVARLKNHGPIKPVALVRPQITGIVRYIFEPAFGVYYYFSGLDIKQWAGWTLWIMVFVWVLPFAATRSLLRHLPLLFAFVFFGLAVYAIVLWIPLLPENMIFGRLLSPVLAGIAATWCGVYYTGRRR